MQETGDKTTEMCWDYNEYGVRAATNREGDTVFTPSRPVDMSTGPSRDIKRKLSPQRTINGLQVANVVQHLVKDGLKQVNESNEAGPSALQIENVPFRPGKEVTSFKANDRDRPSNARLKPNMSNPQASVKGKKGTT